MPLILLLNRRFAVLIESKISLTCVRSRHIGHIVRGFLFILTVFRRPVYYVWQIMHGRSILPLATVLIDS